MNQDRSRGAYEERKSAFPAAGCVIEAVARGSSLPSFPVRGIGKREIKQGAGKGGAGAGEVEDAEGGPSGEVQEGDVFSGCFNEGRTEIDAEGAHIFRAQEKRRRGGALPAAEVNGRESGAQRKPGRTAAGIFQPEVRRGAEFPGSEAGQEKSVQPEAH